jgi:hypothetical protein
VALEGFEPPSENFIFIHLEFFGFIVPLTTNSITTYQNQACFSTIETYRLGMPTTSYIYNMCLTNSTIKPICLSFQAVTHF